MSLCSRQHVMFIWQQVVLVDVRELGRKSGNLHRKLVVERALRTKDQDNERFYQSLRARMERCRCSPHAVLLAKRISRSLSRLGVTLYDSQQERLDAVSGYGRLICASWVLPCRVGIKMSAVEVRFEHLSIDADVRVGGRALPTVFNTFLNFVEVGALAVGLP